MSNSEFSYPGQPYEYDAPPKEQRTGSTAMNDEIARLRWTLKAILTQAHSDMPCEELEDAQADLRAIYLLAENALKR